MQNNSARGLYGGTTAASVNYAGSLTGANMVREADEVWMYLTDTSGYIWY